MEIAGFSSKQAFIEWLEKEAEYPFSGWNFAHISDRYVCSPLPWSYSSIILQYLRTHSINTFLDMGTGGGEFFAQNFQPFPPNTYATESYEPNIPIANKNLQPLGVKVISITDDSNLPFEDNNFDLIINQHESYDPIEVARILKPGGSFITKQVDGDNDRDLYRLFNIPYSENDWHLHTAVQALKKKTAFSILHQYENPMITRLFDVGALVYYLKIVPWAIPDFNWEEHLDQLISIHNFISDQGYIDLNTPRFLIHAKLV